MGTDVKLDHAVSFTNREIKTLIWWLEAANAGDVGSAGRILSTGLAAEHYNSLLPDDPADRTPQQTQQLEVLEKEADDAIVAFVAKGGSEPDHVPIYP